MKWMTALIRLADLEVESLQKRCREIADRRFALEAMLAGLEAEAAAETRQATQDAEAGWYLVGFREGWKLRRAKVEADLHACTLEEQGARDALSTAFEAQKKYETVAETARLSANRETAKRDGAALDEVALRMTGTR